MGHNRRQIVVPCALLACLGLVLLARGRRADPNPSPVDALLQSSPLLSSVFVGITFNWNVAKLAHLRLAVTAIEAWQAQVTICVITNRADLLQNVIDKWALEGLQICHYTRPLDEGQQYALLWAHREVFERAARQGAHTSYLYLEDDTEISWATMVSWAADTEVLEPLGFQRSFIRTEVNTDTGRTHLTDVVATMNISSWKRKVDVPVPPGRRCRVANATVRASALSTSEYWAIRETPSACQHEHFISLWQTYTGLWIATHAKLLDFIAGPYWDRDVALKADKPDPDGFGLQHWKYPERSTGMIQMQDVPNGFWSAAVVPYDPTLKVVLPVAEVQHSRNGYRTPLPVEDLFLDQNASEIALDSVARTATYPG